MAINTSTDLNITSGLASDAGSINNLKNAIRKDPNSPTAIKAASKQFEAMFLNMVMKSMRDATPQDGPFDSEQSKQFTAMLDQQMSQTLAQRGVGLAEVLARQLTVNRTPSPDLSANIGAAINSKSGDSDSDSSDTPLPFRLNSLSSHEPMAQKLHPSPINHALMNSDRESSGKGRGQPQGRRTPKPAHVEAFQSNVTPAAEEASQTTGIPARFMMAQAALESGWGKHVMQNKDGSSSNNLFGIKATAGWKGKVVEATTTEYVHGVATRKVEKFRAYDSYADSFRDYASMLRNNPRYEKVLASAQDMSGFAQGLQRAGYATDPRYAEKLTRIIKDT